MGGEVPPQDGGRRRLPGAVFEFPATSLFPSKYSMVFPVFHLPGMMVLESCDAFEHIFFSPTDFQTLARRTMHVASMMP